MNELKIDGEKLLVACEKCPQVKQFAEEMWPELFEEEVKFKVDDIVEVIKEMHDTKCLKGKIGMIVDDSIRIKGDLRAVEFQEDISGHDCAGRAKGGYGWYVWLENLKLLYRKP